MTQDEIIRMAREAGISITTDWMNRPMLVSIGTHGDVGLTGTQELEHFAALVAAPLQAKIDALMLEYCPDEITYEQMDAWMKHQQPVQECRHCGWLCMPNHNPTKKAYVLQQADVDAAVLAEREACAKVCDTAMIPNPTTSMFDAGVNSALGMCAAAIRARGEK